MKRNYRIAFRSTLVLCGVLGVILNFFSMQSFVTSVSFYTVQSNIVCIIFFSMLIVRDFKKISNGKLYSTVKGGVTICILLTFIVAHFVLRAVIPGELEKVFFGWANVFAHYAAPLMTLADYILFDEKGRYRFTDPLLWIIAPVGYAIYTALYRLLGGVYVLTDSVTLNFPYFFLDYVTYGWPTVTMYCAVIIAFYLGISYIFVAADKGIYKLVVKAGRKKHEKI